MNRVPSFVPALALAAIVSPLPGSLDAQSLWLEPGRSTSVWLEVLRPETDEGFASLVELEPTFASSAAFLGGRLPLTSAIGLVAEVPMAYADVEDGELPDEISSTTLGNPYLGVELGAADAPLWFEVGVRAPLVSDESLGTPLGLVTDFVNRGEAFLNDVVPVNAYANYLWRNGDGVAVRLRGGPSVWIPTEDFVDVEEGDFLSDPELLASYGAQLWYERPRYNLGAGLTGRAALTDEGGFDERTAHQAAASANVVFGRFVPGVQFRVPLDDDAFVDFMTGLQLAVRLK